MKKRIALLMCLAMLALSLCAPALAESDTALPRFEGKPTKKASSIIAFGEGGEVKIIRE